MLKAVLVALLAAVLGLVISIAVVGNVLVSGAGGKIDGLRSGLLLSSLPGAVFGFVVGLGIYYRKRHSEEAVFRYVVSLLTALIGFTFGTALVAPLVLSVDRRLQIMGGMLFGGMPPSFPPRKVNGISVGCFLTPDTDDREV